MSTSSHLPLRIFMGVAVFFGLACNQATRIRSSRFLAPAQAPYTESYAHREDSGFLRVDDNPVSTFAVDVDTASYSNVRRFLSEGQLPPADAVRIEELVNYPHYDSPAAPSEDALAVAAEVGPCPWKAGHLLARVALRAHAARTVSPPRNLTFLVDVSGSMNESDKLPLVKRSLAMLVAHLGPRDRIALVVYAGRVAVVLPPTSGAETSAILSAIDELEAGGSTDGGAAIELGYALAHEAYIEGGINRLIMATDGDFNVGVASPGDLVRLVARQRESGVYLSVLGFGQGNLKDSTMEALADKGSGHYAYIDSEREARRVLVDDAGALVTVARDTKIQVEMNPTEVSSYRLIGYENRAMTRESFDDLQADAGEVGAGQTVTALYELVPVGADAKEEGSPMRYQERAPRTPIASSGELFKATVRYRDPDRASNATHAVSAIARAGLFHNGRDFRLAAALATFGQLLRDSPFKGDATWTLARKLAGDVGDDDLLSMLDAAQRLRHN